MTWVRNDWQPYQQQGLLQLLLSKDREGMERVTIHSNLSANDG